MRKTISSLYLGAVILSLSAVLTAQADTSGHYRWKDAQGNIHYSDRPPEGVESEFIKFSTGKRSTPPADEQAQEQEGEQLATGQRKMEVLPEKDPKLCQQAQANLQALEGARIRLTEADGTQRFLTEKEKDQQRANARKFISIHCD